MTWPKLKKPPIKEAVFDLKFSQNDFLTLENLKLFCESLKDEFPILNEIFLFQVEAKIEKDNNQNVDSKRLNNGFRLSNESRSFILQLRPDGFTFSKIEPYISWEEIQYETKPIIEKLWTNFPNLSFNRVALRYINQFDLNFEEPINEYLNIQPLYPLELPQIIEAFMIRLVIPKKELNLKSIIHLGIEPIANSDIQYTVTFDIDVFKEATYTHQDSERFFTDFETIRDYKNDIFFKGLTQKTHNHFN
jgi:uncharacterized protein (TIGR04255 family)